VGVPKRNGRYTTSNKDQAALRVRPLPYQNKPRIRFARRMLGAFSIQPDSFSTMSSVIFVGQKCSVNPVGQKFEGPHFPGGQ
jgi:hypothetical protein